MPRSRLQGFGFVLLMPLLVATSVFAQEVVEPKPEAKAIPGFEEIFVAGSLLENSKEFQAGQEDEATLTQKRTALESKAVTEALRLLRVWLSKHGNAITPNMLTNAPIANFRQFRLLGRALFIEQYIALANGRVSEAIDSARDGFRLSHTIKPNHYVAWLYGSAIEQNMAISLGQHMDQLSRKDCDRLIGLAQDWLKTPDLAPVVLDIARDNTLETYQKQLQPAEGQLTNTDRIIDPTTGEAKPLPPEVARLSAVERKQASLEVPALIRAHAVRLQTELKKPLWDPAPLAAPIAPKTAAEYLAQPYLERLSEIMRSLWMASGRERAYARMLMCHVMLIRYRWENNRLPDTLATLKLGDAGIDPFSGKPFLYQVQGKRFTLESIGPLARNLEGKYVPGERIRLSLLQ